jgi:hypothetical protein
MKTENDNFDLIDDFMEGNLDEQGEKDFFQRLDTDEDFYQDFQLWNNIDDWLDELPDFEIREALIDIPEVAEKSKKVAWLSSLLRNPFMKLSVACSVLLVLGFGIYFLTKDDGLKELSGQVKFGVVVPLGVMGSGFGDTKGSIKFKNKQFSVERFLQIDTTYTFSRNPFELKFRTLKITETFGENMVIKYNFSTKKYEFYIGKTLYNLEETNTWKKLERLAK